MKGLAPAGDLTPFERAVTELAARTAADAVLSHPGSDVGAGLESIARAVNRLADELGALSYRAAAGGDP